MTTSPADELRAASTTLRAHATAAAENSGSTTWHTSRHFPDQPGSDFTTLLASPGRPLHGGGGRGVAPYMHAPVSEYIALMDPALGLALADWLDRMADANEAANDYTFGLIATLNLDALAVARQINGTP